MLLDADHCVNRSTQTLIGYTESSGISQPDLSKTKRQVWLLTSKEWPAVVDAEGDVQ